MKLKAFAAFFVILSFCCGAAITEESRQVRDVLQWEELAGLPDTVGVAGAFSGVSGDVLIVAGGANFPVPLWKDGRRNPDAKKVYHDIAYMLELPDGQWQVGEKLPHGIAYGASVSTNGQVVCIGGCNQEKFYAEVFRLRVTRDENMKNAIERRSLAPLPSPCAFSCAAKVGDIIYVAGGQESADARRVLKTFRALDLSEESSTWRELEPWPGPGRMLAVAGSQGGSFFLISGCELVEESGRLTRRYLTDAYRYNPGKGDQPGTWRRIADVPRAVAAAPTPAAELGQSHLLVFGGDSGENFGSIARLADSHPGFSRDVLAYHTITDTWRTIGTLDASQVVTGVVRWDDRFIVPSGEIRPGVRTPEVRAASVKPVKAGFGRLDYAAIAVYFAVLVVMGFYFSRREKGTEDFFLAGHRIPWWAAGLSIFVTQLSAITFMAIPAKSYTTNWVYLLSNLMIPVMMSLTVFCYLPFYRRLKVASIYEYLEQRFDLATRLVGSAAFILFQLGRMGIVLFLPALALSMVTGVDIYLCIIVMGVLATLYTALGGIEAVVWTDVLQAVVLLGGAGLSLVLMVRGVEGGFGGIISTAAKQGKLHMVNLDWSIARESVWVVVWGSIFIYIVPYTSDLTVTQRYLTTKTKAEATKAIWTNALMCIPASFLFFFIGTALWSFYKSNPALLNPTGRTDDIFPWFIARQLPAGVAGVVIAGLFAAAMSSLDSSMNSMATAITTDFYQRFKPDVPDEHCLKLARILTVVLGVVGTGSACLMAMLSNASMFDSYLAIVGLLGGGLAGLFAAGIFTRRTNGAGILVGFFVSAIVLFLVKKSGQVHFFLFSFIGITTCVLTGWLASTRIGKQKPLDGLTIYTLNEDGDTQTQTG